MEKARRLMRENKLDAILLEAGSSLYYFTGERWPQSERTAVWILPAKGEPVCGESRSAGTQDGQASAERPSCAGAARRARRGGHRGARAVRGVRWPAQGGARRWSSSAPIR